MSTRSSTCAVLLVWLLAGTAFAQTETVDFGRDILPILRENCVVCHGPTQQMNNFRLDRRSSALRGGTRSVLIPGSSASSRLYLRVAGMTQFGNLMPPTGQLGPHHITLIKAWIDQGAVWPDEYANEEDLPPPDPKAVRIIDALKAGDTATLQALVAQDPKALNLRGPDGTTPFMASVLYSDAATVRQLLEKGADPRTRNDAYATALMWGATNLEKVRALVEHGADVNARSMDGRTPVMIAATQVGTAPIVKFLLEHGAKPDQVALREAASAGDVDVVELLVAHGVPAGTAFAAAMESGCSKCVEILGRNVDAPAASAALLTLSVAARPKHIKFALDRGADPNTADGEGRTPLMNVANSDRLPVESVKLLVDRGANVNAKNNSGQTVLDMAKLHGDGPIVDLLVKAGAKTAAAPAPFLAPLKANTIDAAIRRSLPLIQKADVAFMQRSGCVSCHNEALPQMTVAVARKTGFQVDETMATKQVAAVKSFFEGWRERLLQGVAPGGVAYTLVSLHDMGYQADDITDAIARDIRMRQLVHGNWRPGCGGSRPPLCGYEISNTALSMRALQLSAPRADKAEYARVIQRAAAWLVKATPEVNEDRAFRLLGLVWAGADRRTIERATKDLLDTQKSDGGWSDARTMDSGAFATGQSMVALHEAGLPVTDAAYQRGVKFLLSNQLEDGSWYQKTRSLPVQPYFDVGFPHGVDQWISLSGTSWATMALAYASHGQPPTTLAGAEP